MIWYPIESLPLKTKAMVVVISIRPDYVTDPWVVWRDGESFVRWPHAFQPTHWFPLPSPKSVYHMNKPSILQQVKEEGSPIAKLLLAHLDDQHTSTTLLESVVAELSDSPGDNWETGRSVIRLIANWVNNAELEIYSNDRAVVVNTLLDEANNKI